MFRSSGWRAFMLVCLAKNTDHFSHFLCRMSRRTIPRKCNYNHDISLAPNWRICRLHSSLADMHIEVCAHLSTRILFQDDRITATTVLQLHRTLMHVIPMRLGATRTRRQRNQRGPGRGPGRGPDGESRPPPTPPPRSTQHACLTARGSRTTTPASIPSSRATGQTRPRRPTWRPLAASATWN